MDIKITDFIDCNRVLNNRKFLVSKEACGSFNSFLRYRFSIFNLARHGVKAKISFLLDSKVNTVME